VTPAGAAATAFHERLLAELLTLQRADPTDRLTPALCEAKVDLNPHQIEAAAFALDALPRGGCVLADEVGLGKTIEAGLVIAQLAAEGKRHLLILCPATLRAQWRQELADKLALQARVVDGRVPKGPNPFDAPCPVIASIPFGAARAQELARVPWDLVVIDEAHRLRNAYQAGHKTGRALRTALKGRPKLLLTATPLQNDLLELWGLVSLLDEEVLGPEAAFRLLYGDDAALAANIADDLKARLAPVVKRTLRRQVKEYVRFTSRRSVVEDFVPSLEERQVYEQVSEYLRRARALAVDPARRPLLLLVYRKLLASSTFAIAPTLRKLAQSLRDKSPLDLEEAGQYPEESEEWSAEGTGPPTEEEVAREAAELGVAVELAESVRTNAKGEALVRALDRMFTVARAHQWPEKAVVFTESKRTQEYLARLLAERGYGGKVSRLSGEAGRPEEREALIAQFRDQTQVLLSTEAGAEGLNLQFCNVVVNYDLPWNPQRVEQRIGRCHRYGQPRDVVVINFLNRQNAADARLYELLEKKLQLFDGVFGASDEILGALESGLDFERRVLDIYQSCRSTEEIDAAFESLRSALDGRMNRRMTDARALLFERFDGDVRKRLRLLDERVHRAVQSHADAAKQLTARLEDAKTRPLPPVTYLALDGARAPGPLSGLRGKEGWWFCYRVEWTGLKVDQELLHLVLVRHGADFVALPPQEGALLLAVPASLEARRRPEAVEVSAAQHAALEAWRRAAFETAQAGSTADLDATREQLDRFTEDALTVPRHRADGAKTAWEKARGELRSAGPQDRGTLRLGLGRAEREWRRAWVALRAEEEARLADRDKRLAEATEKARIREHRTLVASAYWWM